MKKITIWSRFNSQRLNYHFTKTEKKKKKKKKTLFFCHTVCNTQTFGEICSETCSKTCRGLRNACNNLKEFCNFGCNLEHEGQRCNISNFSKDSLCLYILIKRSFLVTFLFSKLNLSKTGMIIFL